MDEMIIRRDPRAEWIARNRLHPLHGQLQASQDEVRGPSGVIRKNPHGVGFIGPNGVKRIDRLAGNGSPARIGRVANKSVQVAQLPLYQVESPDYYVVVIPDMEGGRLSGHDKDVLGQAHKLIRGYGGQGAVMAVVFGDCKEDSFGAAGVDRLLQLQGDLYEGYCPEQRVTALADIERQFNVKHWLFPDNVSGGAELGSRLAVILGERPATQVWLADIDSCICRAAGGSQDITRNTPRLLLMAEECADPIDEMLHQALPVTLPVVPTVLPRIHDEGQVSVDPNAISLAEAEFILSAGNGIDDWQQFHQVASVLGATEGASRVAVDDGFMPRFRQVGASGTWVTARVYLAIGISGAIQHMQGIAQCDKVIAINTDAGCDMVKRADLSVIGDSTAVLAELIQLADAYRIGGAEDAA